MPRARFRQSTSSDPPGHAGLWIFLALLALVLVAAAVLAIVLLNRSPSKQPATAAATATAAAAAAAAAAGVVTQAAVSPSAGVASPGSPAAAAGPLAIQGGKTVAYTAQQVIGWNGSCGGKCVAEGDVLSVTMQPGLEKPSNGGMKKTLRLSGGATEVLAEFEVRYGDSSGKAFDFVKGGKSTIGFEFGNGEASGGNWSATAASARCMFRTGGAASLYVYYGKSNVSESSINDLSDQDPEYARHAKPTGTAGHSLWENKKSQDPLPFFKTGTWHKVQIYGRMNSAAKYDGVVAMSVDGQTRSYAKMRWMDKPSTTVQATAVIFFGGSDSTWNPPVAETISLRNIRMTTK